jgi:hypothetical protein
MSLPWLAIPLALATALSTTLGGDLIALSGGVLVAIALLDVLPEAERELGRPGRFGFIALVVWVAGLGGL